MTYLAIIQRREDNERRFTAALHGAEIGDGPAKRGVGRSLRSAHDAIRKRWGG